MTLYGMTGKVLSVDLSAGVMQENHVAEALYRDYIGGSGLAARIFFDMQAFKMRPLSPQSPLMFLDGPFAGTTLSGASRFYVAGRSPLTGLFADSACGGTFAPFMKFAGFDGIVFTGMASEPVYLYVGDGRTELLGAGSLWGEDVYTATDVLWNRHGKSDTSVLLIGPAGENGVLYASIHNNKAHAFGRAGFGALMGSKRLKAVVVKKSGRGKILLAHPKAYKTLEKRLMKEMKEGISFAAMRDVGTSVSILPGTYQGDVPTRNWADPSWEEAAEKLDGAFMAERYGAGRHACWACAVGCKRVTEVSGGKYKTAKGPGPEYETIVSLGQLLQIDDLEAVIHMNEMLNRFGMDSISFGSTLAWAMECFEHGILKIQDTDGLDLFWGNVDAVIASIPKAAASQGDFGRLLAQGSRCAADKLGKSSREWLSTVKGMEAPMHDPRAYFALGLAYAAGSTRGACHMATSTLAVEAGASFYPELGLDREYEAMSNEYKTELVAQSCFLGSLQSAASICHFTQMAFQLDDYLALFNTIAGYEWDVDQMMTAAQRIWYLKRSLNHLMGATAADDALPKRLTTRLSEGPTEGAAPNMERLLEEFYQVMELDPESGKPRQARLEALGLLDVAQQIWP